MKSLPALRISVRADLLAVICAICICATIAAISLFGFSLTTIGIPAVLLALLIDGIARPGSSLLYPTLTHGSRTLPMVALSFDDGPDPETTPVVLDTLAQYGARATFFTIGRSLHANPLLAERMVRERHELANHSWEHSRMQNFFGARRQFQEIERSTKAINTLTASPAPPLYRPPMGLKSPSLSDAARALKLTMVAWSLHSHDTRIMDPKRVAARVLRKIRPGDIVLMHDGHDLPGRHRTVGAQALTYILAGLRDKGLQCVTVSELLNAAQPKLLRE